MELKKYWMRNTDLIQNNTRIIDKNGDKEMLNAKESLNRK